MEQTSMFWTRPHLKRYTADELTELKSPDGRPSITEQMTKHVSMCPLLNCGISVTLKTSMTDFQPSDGTSTSDMALCSLLLDEDCPLSPWGLMMFLSQPYLNKLSLCKIYMCVINVLTIYLLI